MLSLKEFLIKSVNIVEDVEQIDEEIGRDTSELQSH